MYLHYKEVVCLIWIYIGRSLLCDSMIFKSDTVFLQICIEGNIASGKTTCLDYFSQTTSIEVLDVHLFVFTSLHLCLFRQLLVLKELTVNF